MTGKTTTRNRSTRPAFSSERHRVRLPRVRIDVAAWSFISRTAWTGARGTSWVFGHASGSVKVEEKTTFDRPARTSVPGSPSLANPDLTRWVLAPIRTV